MSLGSDISDEGFAVALDVDGETLTLPTLETVQALIEDAEPEEGEYLLGKTEAVGVRVHILRAHLDELTVQVGTVFTDATGKRLRVTHVKDSTANAAVIFTCVNANAT